MGKGAKGKGRRARGEEQGAKGKGRRARGEGQGAKREERSYLLPLST
jgi:hypothetical protein